MSKLFEVQDGDYIQLPWAKFVFHNNEWHVDGRGVNDPTGGSFLGGDGCKLSWKNEQGEEMVLFQMRRNPSNDGEYYFGALDQSKYQEQIAKGDSNALDHAMLELVTINPDGIEFRAPVKFSAGVVGGTVPSGPPSAFPNKLVSPDGRVELDIQNADALNMTLYLDGEALWSILTGATPAGKAHGLK